MPANDNSYLRLVVNSSRLLESITDQNSNTSNKWTYDQYTRALSTEGCNGLGKSLLSYNNTNGARTVNPLSKTDAASAV